MKKLYLVYGNIYFGGYGADINVFGVFTSKEMAEKVKKEKEAEYFVKDQKSMFKELEDISEVEFCIAELCIDTVCDKSLGGYIE